MEDMARVGAVITSAEEFLQDEFVIYDYAEEIRRRVPEDEAMPE